jgi:hypothetical protein
MLYEALLVLPIWLSYEVLLSVLGKYLHHLFVLAAAVPFGIVGSTLLIFVINYFVQLSRRFGFAFCVVSLVLAIFVRLARRKTLQKGRKLSIGFYYSMFFVFLLFVFTTHFLFLVKGTYSGGIVGPDLRYHLQLITSIAYGANSRRTSFWHYKTTFYANASWVYPILPDFHAAVLLVCGASVRMSILVPTVLLGCSIFALLYSLAMRLSRTRFVPGLAIYLFVMAGGNGWKEALNPKSWESASVNFAHRYPIAELFWLNSILHFLLPQRSAVFSMPLVLMAMLCIVQSTSGQRKRPILFLVAGVAVGMIPFTSGHSFLAICMWVLFLAIFEFDLFRPQRWGRFIVEWLWFGIPVLVIGLPQCLMFIGAAKMSINPIWTEYYAPGFPVKATCLLWWNSLSVFVIITVFHCWFALNERQIKFYLPSICIFVISNFLRYQSGAMNNSKVFFAGWYVIAVVCAAEFIITLYRSSFAIFRFIAIVFLIEMSATSVCCFIQTARLRYLLLDEQSIIYSHWIDENVPIDAIAFTDRHGHSPFCIAAGRTSLMSFVGWTHSLGIDSTARMSLLDRIIESDFTPSLVVANGVSYAEIISWLMSNFSIGERDRNWNLVFREGRIQLYEYIVPPF